MGFQPPPEITVSFNVEHAQDSPEYFEAGMICTRVPGKKHAWQVAAVSVPARHDELPLMQYPGLQVGWQLDPDARASEQSPIAPFAGGVVAWQVAEEQMHLSEPLESPVFVPPTLNFTFVPS